MAWARIDDKFLDNPKIRKAGKEATYLYVSGLVYSSSQLTEGFIGDDALGLVAYKGFIENETTHADTLVECGLWDRIDGGFLIHDYLKYNPTKAEIEAARAKKIAAGIKGGQASAKARAQADGQASASISGRNQANCQADAQALFKQTSSIIPSPKEEEEEGVKSLIFKAWENEIGGLTSFISDNLVSALDDYSAEWVLAAIREAAEHDARNWKYVEAVLKGWKKCGFRVDTRAKRQVDQPKMRKLRGADGEVIEVPA